MYGRWCMGYGGVWFRSKETRNAESKCRWVGGTEKVSERIVSQVEMENRHHYLHDGVHNLRMPLRRNGVRCRSDGDRNAARTPDGCASALRCEGIDVWISVFWLLAHHCSSPNLKHYQTFSSDTLTLHVGPICARPRAR